MEAPLPFVTPDDSDASIVILQSIVAHLELSKGSAWIAESLKFSISLLVNSKSRVVVLFLLLLKHNKNFFGD